MQATSTPNPAPATAPAPAAELSIKDLFEFAAKNGASDLIVTAGAPPSVRIDGELKKVGDKALIAQTTHRLIWSILNQQQQQQLERERELELSVAVSPELRFRANVYYQKGAVAGAFRLVTSRIPPFKELGLPAVCGEILLRPHGLILVTGPDGSGKSTTLASMVDAINDARRCHVVTIEDPIEYVHRNKKAVVDQREVGGDTLSYANALRHAVRQNPDVLVIGEVRDTATVQAALDAAESGPLVFATLHTADTVLAVDRLVDFFPPSHHGQVRTQLALTLLMVIAQQLIPKKGGKGRVLGTEVLIKNQNVALQLREGKTAQTKATIESAGGEGMITMDHRLKSLYEAGHISFEEAARRVSSGQVLRQLKPPKEAVKDDAYDVT